MSKPNEKSELAKEAKKELARRELARRHLLDCVKYNFEAYQVNWHHELIAEKLEAIERGDITRLMIFMPPRFGKSELSSKQFPAWYLGRNPEKEIIAASYGAELAMDFGRKTRNIFNSTEFKKVFKNITVAEDSSSAGRWNTNRGGAYVAAGVGGAITGRGANLLIIDDPLKNWKEAYSPVRRKEVWDWYTSTAYTRLSPNGAIVLIMTRWHKDDLAGRLLEDMKNEGDQWEILNLPAIAETNEKYRKKGSALWPEQYSLERLGQIKTTIGTAKFNALYQQDPFSEEHQEFKSRFFKMTTEAEADHRRHGRYLTIDPALSEKETDDFTGWVDNRVDADNNWHISARRLRLNSAQLLNLLFTEYEKHHYDRIGIEKEKYLQVLKPWIEQEERKRNVFLPITELAHGGRAKALRIRGLLPRYEAGAIYHIHGQCGELEEELIEFPLGGHDDLADALAYQTKIAEAPEKPEHKNPFNIPINPLEPAPNDERGIGRDFR